MDLLLVRHAIAEEQRPELDDAERALTEDGQGRFALAVAGLQRLGLTGDACWHSPWKRAAETARLLSPVIAGELRVEPLLALAPGEALLAKLRGAAPGHRLALVGHQPWLGALAAWLCLGRADSLSGVRVRKGGLVWLKGSPAPGGMQIEAVLKPQLLRQIGALAARESRLGGALEGSPPEPRA
ncbi:MAG: histidine phosphatase family protein [Planctomycetota bacterium]